MGKIPKNEFDLLSAAINRIVSTEVLEKIITEELPKVDDLSDSNKIYQGKVSVLFVDMRDSTRLPDEFDKEQLVKIYRSYIRTIVQAVRYSGGIVRDFMGDGVLAVFTDDANGSSEDKSVNAARYIATVIEKVLNPILDKEIHYRVSCGIGIHTGEVSLSKVGMRGKEQDEDTENEFGVAWIGSSTNLACKFSGAVGRETIFISASTYAALSNLEEKQKWKRIEIKKGNNILNGYVAEQHFLELDEEVEPCRAAQKNIELGLEERLVEVYRKQLEEITTKAEKLGKKEQELQEKEKRINTKSLELEQKEKDINEETYEFYRRVLASGHCEKDYVKAMGKDFWDENLKKAIEAGAIIGKSEADVKEEICYAMVSIYQDLEIYEDAYNFFVIQVSTYPWFHFSTAKDIVEKGKVYKRLGEAVQARMEKGNLAPKFMEELRKIHAWLILLNLQASSTNQ